MELTRLGDYLRRAPPQIGALMAEVVMTRLERSQHPQIRSPKRTRLELRYFLAWRHQACFFAFDQTHLHAIQQRTSQQAASATAKLAD
jgi:hypothetical protein